MEAKLINFPTHDVLEKRKIDRLTELKQQYLRLQELEEVIIEEVFAITGEEERNGHTWDFLVNDPEQSAEDLLSDMVRNPSDLWEDLDSKPDPDPAWPELF